VRRWISLLIIAGCVALFVSDAAAQQKALVHTGSRATYLANVADPGIGAAWVAPDFDDSAWSVGTYGIGYDRQREAGIAPRTAVPSGTFSIYTRTRFLVADPGEFNRMLLGGDYIGSIAVWINGTEVFRSPGLAAGRLELNPLNRGASSRLKYESRRDLSAAGLPALRPGENVLAIGMWNDAGSAGDLFLDPHVLVNSTLALARGPYLQSSTPTRVVVRWRTDENGDSRVVYGTEPGRLSSSVVDPAVTDEHIVTLSGLDPDTKYYYAVGTSTEILAGADADHFFVTSPVPGDAKPTRIWILGDSGTGNADADAVRDAYYDFTADRHTDLWLMLGDNAYPNGTDSDYQDALFNMYPEMLRKSCLWPTLGNHDGHSADSSTQSGSYYTIFTLPTAGEAGGVPSGTEAYYSFDYSNIHFVVLDSYDSGRSPSGPMLTWLDQDLASTVQDWIIAYWHHPPYTKGSHDSDYEPILIEMRENALPILESHGVDLVLGGHSHSYERSFLINGHYDDSSTLDESMFVNSGDGREYGDGVYQENPEDVGTVYTVAGSSGKTGNGSLDHPVMVESLKALGSVVLDIDAGRLDALFLDHDGTVRDHYTIDKGGDPNDEPPLPPTSLRVS
jgi:hypothetical protein